METHVLTYFGSDNPVMTPFEGVVVFTFEGGARVHVCAGRDEEVELRSPDGALVIRPVASDEVGVSVEPHM